MVKWASVGTLIASIAAHACPRQSGLAAQQQQQQRCGLQVGTIRIRAPRSTVRRLFPRGVWALRARSARRTRPTSHEVACAHSRRAWRKRPAGSSGQPALPPARGVVDGGRGARLFGGRRLRRRRDPTRSAKPLDTTWPKSQGPQLKILSAAAAAVQSVGTICQRVAAAGRNLCRVGDWGGDIWSSGLAWAR